MKVLVYVDGKMVPKEEAVVSVFDHGFLYGDGVFEGIRVYEGNVFRLKEHIDRLYESAKTIALEIPIWDFRDFVKSDPDIAWKLLQHVVNTLLDERNS